MAVHPFDYELQTDFYSTPELRDLFDERARMARWLRFEAALAEAQGELGVIPKTAAAVISQKAFLKHLDLDGVREGYKTTRNSVMPILKALRTACGPEHGEFVHHGATTQDAIDTGEMLALKDGLAITLRDLLAIEGELVTLADRHRQTPMIGRSHGQQAIPITFGLKVAIWLGELRRHIERLKSVLATAPVGQLGGAVGTMAALTDQAPEVKRRVMNKLGLVYALPAWHTSRDNVAEACSVLTMATATAAKIADEVFELGRTEFGELREPAGSPGAMSSSTMPHKRNPVLCQRIKVMETHVRSLLSVVMESMSHQNERDPRALWAEWLAVPQMLIYSGAIMAYLKQITAGLEVYPERMLANLHIHGDLVSSEWLLFRLAGRVGKVKAQNALHKAGEVAAAQNVRLVDALRADPEMSSALTAEDLERAEQPERYTGWSETIVDEVLDAVRAARALDTPLHLEPQLVEVTPHERCA